MFPNGLTLSQSYSYDLARLDNVRFDKLAAYLTRGVLPGMDERDLLSFGVFEIDNYQAALNDNALFSAKNITVVADQYEWFIPTDFSIELDDAVFGTQVLAEFGLFVFDEMLASAAEEGEDPEAALFRDGIGRAIEQLADHQLDSLPFDASLAAYWDFVEGPTNVQAELIADGYGEHAFSVELGLPTYDAVQLAYESEDQGAQFEDAFEAAFSFRGLRLFERDLGGYAKLFGYAHDLGEIYADQGWGAMLAGMEPADMRTYVGTLIRMGKASAEAEFAPAAEWLESYATYLETGGEIEFRVAPPQPINEALIDSYEDEPSPEEIVELFGITVTHKK